MRIASQIAAACLLAAATPALPRPFSTADLLAAEEFGQMAFTPDGKRLVFERLIAFEQSGPFEYDAYPPLRRGRIYVQEVGSAAPPRLLLKPGPQEGHTAGPISPGGRRMAILRLKGRALEVGVVDLATGDPTWLGVIPELAQLGQTIAWRSDHELLIAARTSIPLRLRAGWQAREMLQGHWSAAARGEPALTQVSAAEAFSGDTRPAGRLLLIDVETGVKRLLAEGDFYDLQLSPDGRRLVAMAHLEALTPSPAPRLVATPNRRRNLVVVDLAGGAVLAPCPDCDLDPHLIAWSPDSGEVLVHGRRKQGSGLMRLSAIGPEGVDAALAVMTGGLAPVIDATSEGHAIPRAAWWGGAPIALLQAPGGRADWYALGGGSPINLTARLPSPPDHRLAANDGARLFVTSAGETWEVGREGPVRAGLTPVPPQGLSLSSRERQNLAPRWLSARLIGPQARNAPAAANAHVTPNAPPQAAAPDAAAGPRPDGRGGLDLVLSDPKPRVVMSLNREFSDIEFASVRKVKAQGGMEHYLLLPPKPRTVPPPLIVVPYPGLAAYPPPRPYGGGTGRFPANAELMAAAGYAVLVPALPRPSDLEPAEGIADQILDAVDLAAREIGGFDPAHPILWGHSFGGYSVLMAASQSERFAAVIALAAPSNLSSLRGAFDPHGEALPQDGLSAYLIGVAEAGQARLRAGPWERPDLYVRSSPLFQAGGIHAPVLLIHGDTDFVRLSQAQEMFMALARQARDVTLITAHGEGHIVSSPGNLRELYERAFRWLAKRTAPRQTPEAHSPQM